MDVQDELVNRSVARKFVQNTNVNMEYNLIYEYIDVYLLGIVVVVGVVRLRTHGASIAHSASGLRQQFV